MVPFTRGQTAAPPSNAAASSSPANPSQNGKSRIVQDPYTGRTYRQEVVDVKVPTTRWEQKAVTQTYYEPVTTTKYVTTQQVVYVPQQTYALQSYMVGRWNPFRNPALAYYYRPVTNWIPALQNQQVPLTSQNFVPKQRTVYVSQPVQREETTQQIVTTEIPSQGVITPAGPNQVQPNVMYASQPAPRVRIPILANQTPLTSFAANTSSAWNTSRNSLAAVTPRPLANPGVATGLRPIANAAANYRSTTYSAPMRTASAAASLGRDPLQSGMSATVLR